MKPTDAFRSECFRGRVYGVTGAAHGIGEATTDSLLKAGARVVVIDHDQEQLSRVREKWRRYGDAVLLKFGDVAEEKTLKSTITAAHRRLRRVDGWVSNAAMNPFGKVESQSAEDFERGWRVNTLAAWRTSQLLLPIMRKQGGGTLVNVGSMLAHQTYPFNASYVSSKAALEGSTRALAVELADDRIRINAVVPGMIDTFHYETTRRTRRTSFAKDVPQKDVDRWRELRQRFREHQWRSTQPWPTSGHGDQVAAAILFLLSDAASFVTGARLVVDGGMTVFHPRMIAMKVGALAEDQREIIELGERYPALQLRHMLKYRAPQPKKAGKTKKRK